MFYCYHANLSSNNIIYNGYKLISINRIKVNDFDIKFNNNSAMQIVLFTASY